MQTLISPFVSHSLRLAPPLPRNSLLNNYHQPSPIRLSSHFSTTSLRLAPPLPRNSLLNNYHQASPIRLSSHFSTTSLRLFNSGAAAAAAASRDSEMTTEDGKDPRIAKIASSIRIIPDFPKPGIMFQDITTLLLDTEAFKDTIALFVERYQGKGISVVAGVEARGFIFGPPIALAIGAKFVPMRKPNKLPGKVISEEYSLEYGTDKMEMHVGAVEPGECAIIIDDLIATGGTLAAAIRLLERVGVKIVECACVIELPELKGKEKLGDAPLFVLVSSA